MPVKLDQIKKGGVYRYEETFDGNTSKAIVKIINTKHTEDSYVFVVIVLAAIIGHFPKSIFRIVITGDYLKEGFYEVGNG